ncbi:MAG: glycosyltransferase family 39 protein [Phycisphaerae bacterium]|nr:glycosyltransferase family 39 protein [Phycisphaerae bacterium]NUQ44781.1 glycosyltransferase family 39 protein [Phycisphaerae bacterium]
MNATPTTSPRSVNTGMMLAGLAALTFAAFTSSGAIETFLFDHRVGSMSWGPALFRAVLAFHGLVLLLFAVRKAPANESRHDVVPRACTTAPVVESPSTGAVHWILLIALSLAAAGLRLYKLESPLWYDESVTLLHLLRAPPTEAPGDFLPTYEQSGDPRAVHRSLRYIAGSFPTQNQHMLFTLLARVSFSVFGESAWALRLPAALFGVADLWMLFLFGRRLIGPRESLLAAALMCVSYHHVWFSQNARAYTGLLLFTMLATLCWMNALRSGTWRSWIAYAGAAALGMYAQLNMQFVVAAHGLLWLVRLFVSRDASPGTWRVRLWRPLAAFVLCVTFTLQLYAPALPEFLRSAIKEYSLPSNWNNPLWLVRSMLEHARVGLAGAALGAVGGVVLLIGWMSILRRNLWAGLAMVLPGVLLTALMLSINKNLYPRFYFFCMGFGLLMIVRGMIAAAELALTLAWRDPRARAWGRTAGVTGVALMIVAFAGTLPRCYALPKQDFIGARDYVEARRGPRDIIVAVGLAAQQYRNYVAPSWSEVRSAREVRELARAHDNVWLVYSQPDYIKPRFPDLWALIESECPVDKEFRGTLGEGQVYVCRYRPGAR